MTKAKAEAEASLINLRLTVIRFSNEEVGFDMDKVMSRIYSTIESIKSKKFKRKII